jgi:aromatic ring hydroxylase
MYHKCKTYIRKSGNTEMFTGLLLLTVNTHYSYDKNGIEDKIVDDFDNIITFYFKVLETY